VSGALGADAGISGALGLVIVGNGSLNGNEAGDDPLSELDKGGNGSLTSMNSFGGSSNVSSAQMGGQLSDSDAAAINAASKVSLLDSNHNLKRTQDGTQALVSNSSITTVGLNVTGTGTTSVTNVVGNLAGGGFLGAGGAIGFSVVNQAIGAHVDTSSTIDATGLVKVSAKANNGTATAYSPTGAESGSYSVATSAYQGAAGLVGLGAAVSISQLNNQVNASLDGDITGHGSNAVNISAEDDSAVAARGGGLVAGGAAAGVVVSQAQKNGSVNAGIAANTTIGNSGALSISATSQGSSSAKVKFRQGNGSHRGPSACCQRCRCQRQR